MIFVPVEINGNRRTPCRNNCHIQVVVKRHSCFDGPNAPMLFFVTSLPYFETYAVT